MNGLTVAQCRSVLRKDALDLIETMETNVTDAFNKSYDEGYKDGIKEFAERLKAKALIDTGFEVLQLGTIDYLVKEMVGDKLYYIYGSNGFNLTVEKIVIKEEGMFLVDKTFNDWYSIEEEAEQALGGGKE